jgi:lipoyl(octanoyl) transferase
MRTAAVIDLGRTDYQTVFQAMQTFTEARDADTEDQIWLTEHEPVFTQGQAGKPEHLLAPGDIPVVQSDRGGQVTYHGPGQLVAYLLFDIRRMNLSVRELVSGIENALIDMLSGFEIDAAVRTDAPGVYVDGAKIGSLGLRVRRGCSYHGLALNVNMDLEPFSRINPCGLLDTAVVQTADLGGPESMDQAKSELLSSLAAAYRLSFHTLDKRDSSAA